MSRAITVEPVDAGLTALCGIAAYYHIAVDPAQVQRDLALGGQPATSSDVLRAARRIGLKAKVVVRSSEKELLATPTPAIIERRGGGFMVYGGCLPAGLHRIVDPLTSVDHLLTTDELFDRFETSIILVARRIGGEGAEPRRFGLRWFLPSIWRYRKPLSQVLLASLFVQLLALVTPLFFQVIVDKVLAHRAYSTLLVLVAAVGMIAVFDALLQYQRSYALAHTTNKIDVELGQRLYRHLLRLPLAYFETRPAGQTVARVRELENIRAFLTGQALFSALDLVFTGVFLAVLFAYSVQLSLIVVAAIPIYVILALAVRPALQERIRRQFNAGALSQQFLVESVIGVETLKAAAVEPIMQAQWEDRLAGYVKASFAVTCLGALGQNGVSFVSKIVTALLMLFGAKAVMDGQLSIGGLVAFNMIAAQVTQPVLRLSQLWQDFQQMQVSVERLGDILDAPAEPAFAARALPPKPRGRIDMKAVTFRYRPGSPEVLRRVSLSIEAGEMIGIVGPSGSGKSTLSKLIQRLYAPQDGQILLDGIDLSQADPSWLRSNIGVVLQDSMLFNRTIHDNIALANPAMPRASVIALARLSGADEFISKLPGGYDTIVEERGANLSGGQRQRIAIARALANDPPILIFDEATSALDYESERVIQMNMRQIAKGRTVIIIAHRLAAVRHCDRIIALVDGQIAEAGSHDELTRLEGGTYRKLWMLQTQQVAA